VWLFCDGLQCSLVSEVRPLAIAAVALEQIRSVWGEGVPVQSESGGTDPAPPLFGSNSTIGRFGERFRDDQYSFLFAVLLLTVPRFPAICKSGGHVPPCPLESAALASIVA